MVQELRWFRIKVSSQEIISVMFNIFYFRYEVDHIEMMINFTQTTDLYKPVLTWSITEVEQALVTQMDASTQLNQSPGYTEASLQSPGVQCYHDHCSGATTSVPVILVPCVSAVLKYILIS